MKPSDPSLLLPALPERAEILILRHRSLGDIILETPAIAALHAWRPDLRICVLIEPRFAAALEGNPAISDVIFSEDLRPTIAEVRRHRFPILFNQHGGPRSAWIAAASAARTRVCWSGFQLSFLYNVRAPDAAAFYGKPVVHTVEHRISQFYFTGLPRGPIPRTHVFPQPQAMESAARILAANGLSIEQQYAVLQPGARLPQMRWPAERFAAVARWLRERHGIASIVNLDTRDAALAADARAELAAVATIPPPLALGELIALISRARLFIGCDSGPVHISAATGCPGVVIYGTTNPAQWHPWQAPYRAIHTGATFRAPRGDKNILINRARAISSISADEVSAAGDELLAETPRRE